MRNFALVLGALAFVSCRTAAPVAQQTNGSVVAGGGGLIVSCENAEEEISFTLSSEDHWWADGVLPYGKLTVKGELVDGNFVCIDDTDINYYRTSTVHPKRISWCRAATAAGSSSLPGPRVMVDWAPAQRGIIAFGTWGTKRHSARVLFGATKAQTAVERMASGEGIPLSCRFNVPEDCKDCLDPSKDEY